VKAIVSDATSLIILAKLDRVSLLRRFFDQVVIPSMVMGEVQAKPDHDPAMWRHDWIRVEDGTHLGLYHEFVRVLDHGESEALALADAGHLPLLIDEKKGRAIAGRRGIPVVGLVGLLLRSVQRNHSSADEARRLLADARAMGFRLSDNLAQEFEAALAKAQRGATS
jgi:predicted nucleic acid-binding protein